MITPAFIVGNITAVLLTRDISSQLNGVESLNRLLAVSREGLAQLLPFIKANLQATKGRRNDLESSVRVCYEALFYVETTSSEAEMNLPFETFSRVCELSEDFKSEGNELEETGSEVTKTFTRKDITTLAYHMNFQRQLCSIDLASPQNPSSLADRDSNPGSSASATLKTTVGLCSRNTKIGDVVTVVRGCRSPLILRSVGNRYELIGEVYVHGFMRGEAVERFPEVEIELI